MEVPPRVSMSVYVMRGYNETYNVHVPSRVPMYRGHHSKTTHPCFNFYTCQLCYWKKKNTYQPGFVVFWNIIALSQHHPARDLNIWRCGVHEKLCAKTALHAYRKHCCRDGTQQLSVKSSIYQKFSVNMNINCCKNIT